MPSFAIIGATGNTGSALVELLLRDSANTIHAYCRNQAKFSRLIPEAAKSDQVTVFEGDIDDSTLLAKCISGCKAVFLVASTNDNIPGYDVGQRATRTIISALDLLGVSPQHTSPVLSTPPKILLLSSATIDDTLSQHTPRLLRRILLLSESHVYADLRRAEAILRAEQHWLTTIFMKPGALVVDKPRGYMLSFTDETSPLAYADLAAGMIEAVSDDAGEMYDMRNVAVVSPGGPARFPLGTPLAILTGLLRHFWPGLHAYLPLSK